MGAPNKIGLKFYRSNTNRYQDSKIRRLLRKYKGDGIAVWDYILNEIYRLEGCFIKVNNDIIFNTADNLNIEEELVKNVVEFCVEIELFSEEIFKKYGILTSESIQKFYKEACIISKRKSFIIPELIYLITEEMELITEETKKNQEETIQHNITEHNRTNSLFISRKKEDFEKLNLKPGDPFFYINGILIPQKLSAYFEQEFTMSMEGELMNRKIDKEMALQKLDEKYNFTEFSSSKHLFSSFKCCLDLIEKGEVKKPAGNKNGNHSKSKKLTNWDAIN